MSAEELLPDVLRDNRNDHITASAKAFLGAVPFAGSLLAELAGVAIPNQRIDRVSRFASELDRRLAGVEEEIVKKKWDEDRFLELAEEVVRQAARATSDERRAYLAEILADEMTREQLEENDRRHLLRMLGELNDVEVVWLRHYAGTSLLGWHEFQSLHADILEQKTFGSYPSDAERLAAWTLRDGYRSHLAQLGLLNQELSVGHGNVPEMEWGGRQFRYSYDISRLGIMLLEMIGFQSRSRIDLEEFEKG